MGSRNLDRVPLSQRYDYEQNVALMQHNDYRYTHTYPVVKFICKNNQVKNMFEIKIWGSFKIGKPAFLRLENVLKYHPKFKNSESEW